MADLTEQTRPSGGALYTSISNAIVVLLREYTGRGPTKARTTIRDNVVLVMLEQTLTKGEQALVGKGRATQVLELRHEYQQAMSEDCIAKVSELTGRKVVAMLSANHVDPDLGAEIFVLDGPPQHGHDEQSQDHGDATATPGTTTTAQDSHPPVMVLGNHPPVTV
ncbi:MAG: Na-translocating system protein MpsC family protein [Solirubrobacteraceae bacterium]